MKNVSRCYQLRREILTMGGLRDEGLQDVWSDMDVRGLDIDSTFFHCKQSELTFFLHLDISGQNTYHIGRYMDHLHEFH